VGYHYVDFSAPSEEQVLSLLDAAAQRGRRGRVGDG
jgi:predicted phosphoribosyltransferase